MLTELSLWQVIGVFAYMYIFGEIVSIMQNFDLTSASFNARRDMVPPDTTLHPNDLKILLYPKPSPPDTHL